MINNISLLDLTEADVVLNTNNSQSQTYNQQMILPKVNQQDQGTADLN